MNTQSAHTPLVSVIMPAYNAQDYIAEAVGSVLAQTMADLELIVIDDGSSDRTVQILEALAGSDHRIRFLRNEKNAGVSRTRNRGLDLARGQYIALLDSDDAWYPEKLRCQLDRMEQTGADLCYCSYRIVDASGKPVRPDYLVPEQVDFQGLLRENVILCSSLLIRAQALDNRRFAQEFYHEDYVLELDLLRSGCKAVGCPEILARWRYIENSRSFNKWNCAKMRWKIYRRHLGLPLAQSIPAFCCYAFAGLRKYLPRNPGKGGTRLG